MTRRRRRLAIPAGWAPVFALLLISLLLIQSAAEQHYKFHQHHNQHQHHHNFDFQGDGQQHQQHQRQPAEFNVEQQHSMRHLCSLLPPPTAKLMRLCKLIVHSPNADEAVALGAARGLAECRNQFKQERWNCTHSSGEHHLLTSRLAQTVGTRESGFVQAIAAAGIVHSIATACNVGSLSDCACDKTRIGLIRQKDQIWKWGGCSNNIRHGMVFAKHLVELLDAIHQHQTRPVVLASDASVGGELAAAAGDLQQHSSSSFCQQNHNLSQTAHQQLIKSLLARNSLEKHQRFRLAMNLHNNKVGRMTVSKNMEIKCRCHGLSGSCSLKTCWLKLPDFQQIGNYLKWKYETSVHLPTNVNMNKLISMMDRNEISAILASTSGHGQELANGAANHAQQLAAPGASGAASGGSMPARHQQLQSAEYAALVSNAPQPPPPAEPSPVAGQVPAMFSYYERHKQQLEGKPANTAESSQPSANSTLAGRSRLLSSGAVVSTNGTARSAASNTTEDADSELLLLRDVAPLTQQQYQSLLRDLKLCNPTAAAANGAQLGAHPTTRDFQHQLMGAAVELGSISNAYNELRGSSHLHKKSGSPAQPQQQHHHHQFQQQQATNHLGRDLKQANQQLAQALHPNLKDDLIHLHKSPDYCSADPRHGFAGVQARVCSENPAAADSCDKLCCGRGYEARESQLKYNCDCKFQYCCKIHCNFCTKKVVEYVCK